jgi:TRAP-type C4-dicarboxylate transport system permease small subunit
MSTLAWLHDAMSRALFWCAGTALAVATVLYLVEVVARYGFNAPTTWTVEVVEYALLAIIFLALPEVTRTKAHITMDLISGMIGPRKAERLARVNGLLAAMACFLSAYIAGNEAARQFGRGLLTNAANPIPRWWLTAIISFGLANAALHFLRQTIGRRQ